DGIRDFHVTGVQTCALPIFSSTALPRTSVLGSKAQGRAVDESLLVEQAEKELYYLIRQKAGLMDELFENKKYEEYLEELSSMRRSEERRVGKECKYR